MDAKYAYSLNLNNVKRICFDRYENNFTFIVNGKRYETNRIIADLISPIIMKIHYQDESFIEYSMNTSNSNEYFPEFLNLVNFESVELDENRRRTFSEYFLQLGNIEEYLQLQPNFFQELTPSNIVDYLLKIKKISTIQSNYFDEENTFCCPSLKKMIEFCSENFNDIPKEELFKLDSSTVEEIIRNENLKLEDEDELLEILIEMYEKDNRFSFLFEYVYFNQVRDETLSKFVDAFDVDDMNSGIWNSICLHLKKSTNKRSSIKKEKKKEEESKDEIIELQHKQGKDFDGIMKYLVDKTGGNIHDNGTIEISANSMYNNSNSNHPKNIVDYNNSNAYQANGTSILLQFDFKIRQVQLSSYTIKTNGSRHLRSWIIETSNDLTNWEIIDVPH